MVQCFIALIDWLQTSLNVLELLYLWNILYEICHFYNIYIIKSAFHSLRSQDFMSEM